MANPVYPSDGGSSKVDGLINSAGVATFKRGYLRETPAGATTDTQHMGVAEIPAAVVSAASTASPATVTASMPAITSGTNYLDGLILSGTGANATSVVQVQISGISTPVIPIYVAVPSGANTAITPLHIEFPHPIPASAPSTAITVTVPSFGTGSTGVGLFVYGHKSL